MATAPDASLDRIVDLRYLPQHELSALLALEVAAWREQLHWDFASSAELVARFVKMHALQGFGLVVNGQLAGYSYYVTEDHKGLIGDVFVAPDIASPAHEYRLLDATLNAIMRVPAVRRVESQLMMLRHGHHMTLPVAASADRFGRQFMSIATDALNVLPRVQFSDRVAFEPWHEGRFEEASSFIAHSYRTHVDSVLNDQYRSAPGARRFLLNITQYPGCGQFVRERSMFAVDRQNNRILALILVSSVAAKVGHITQVCVSPQARGQGIGYELIRRALEGMRQDGKVEATLTVTSNNESAVRLYERMGFQTIKTFQAFVWDGFRR